MAQSEWQARDLEDRLGAKRFVAVDFESDWQSQASREYFQGKNRLLENLQTEKLDRHILFGLDSKKSVAEFMKELARGKPGGIVEVEARDNQIHGLAISGMWYDDCVKRPRDPLLLLC